MSILQAVPEIGIPVKEEPISAYELLAADEVFTAHTGIKVEAITRLENRELPEGAITKQVMKLMDDIIQFKDDRFQDWFQPLF
jgi:branched-subunit amino acid aminotransferase/4-amino-4-deoxychorismate lyase